MVPTGLGTLNFESNPWPAGNLAQFGAWIWKDTQLVLGDLAVPCGATVIFSPWVVHRDPQNWPDPLRFDPSRFADAARVDLTRWFPFGLGHRACIGSNLALSQLVVTVSRLCRDLHLAPHPANQPVQTVPIWRVLLEPRADGARLCVGPRTLSRP